tara:strand:- start:102 stop:254 length:153 start_codon:yes stop_codon:yes gene_type:complete
MKVNQAAWDELKKLIEHCTDQDSNITDITINYQVKEVKELKNYLHLNIKQ